ncbi:hypothetical protein C9890_0545 [Perkinsus sp. BL_2016]|nr:hypothetical protein C9890_0545 [Perkinsus sp. BL_2016]
MAVPWREIRPKGRSESYGSVLLFPSGLQGISRIRAVTFLKRERLAVAVLDEDRGLCVFTDAPSEERPLFGTRIFNPSLQAKMPDLVRPGVICLTPRPSDSSAGESLFVFDSESDMVCEFRFESTLLGIPRACPDSCLLHWYLESGISVSEFTRINVRIDEDSNRSVTIVGRSSNGDSQGRVKLVSARDQHFLSPFKWVRGSVQSASRLIISNSMRNLRILTSDDFDFPLFIRQPVEFVWSFMTSTRVDIAVIVTGGRLMFFEIRNNEMKRISSIDPFDGISDGQVSVAVDEHGRTVYVGCCTKSGVELWTFDLVDFVSPCLVTCLESVEQTRAISVRAPVSPQDTPSIACIDGTQKLHANFAIDSTVTASTYLSVCFSDEYVMTLCESRMCVEIHSLISGLRPRVYRVHLPKPCDHIRSRLWRNTLVVITDNSVVLVRAFDPYRGVIWTAVDLNLCDELFDLTDDAIVFLEVTSGKLLKKSIPNQLWNIRMSVNKGQHSILQECLSLSTPNCPEWYKLSGELRDRVEPLISPSEDVVRNSDFFARKFLISHAFSSITTEDLAWARMSEFQAYMTASLFGSSGSISWASLRSTGIAYWLNEPSLLRDLVDRIQKSSLQEYMRSKDPTILDDEVSVWLAVLGKQQLLASLYKQHGNSCASQAHVKISIFFTTNFSTPENASKAIKNAFELVRQKRNTLAVAVFILAGAFQEAVDICSKQMDDVQLGLVLLMLLKLRCHEDTERLETIIRGVWENRVVKPALESADIWLPLLDAWRTRNVESAIQLRQRFHDDSALDFNTSDGLLFPSKHYDVCYPSVGDYVKHFADSMKRFNRHVPEEVAEYWNSVAEEDRLMCLYQTGCSQYAITSPNIHSIHPILKWCIHERMMLSRSDTSTG